MKTLLTLCALLCALAVSSLSSCVADKFDTAALFPTARLAWPAVQEDISRGIADGVDDGELSPPAAEGISDLSNRLGEALQASNSDALRTIEWPTLEEWAHRGIADKLADGEIGPGVADSLSEQLSNFTTTIQRLKEIF